MSEDDPYRAPSAELEPRPQNEEGDIILQPPRVVGVGRSFGWIAEAFNMFRHYPLPWILTGLIQFGMGMLLGLVPFAGGALSTMINSVVLGGVMLGCAAQEFGEDYSINYVFLAFSRPYKLISVSLIYTVVSYVILLSVLGPFGRTLIFGGLDPQTMEQQLEAMSGPILLTAVLMIPLIMATWFSIVLIALHNVSVVDAVRLSFQGCLRNLLPMIVLGLVFCLALGILFSIGMAPFAIGVLVMYPIMFISTYTAYRDIFTHEQVGVK